MIQDNTNIMVNTGMLAVLVTLLPILIGLVIRTNARLTTLLTTDHVRRPEFIEVARVVEANSNRITALEVSMRVVQSRRGHDVG